MGREIESAARGQAPTHHFHNVEALATTCRSPAPAPCKHQWAPTVGAGAGTAQAANARPTAGLTVLALALVPLLLGHVVQHIVIFLLGPVRTKVGIQY
jgi:hypothetical protein